MLEMQNGVLSCQRLKGMRRRSREPQQQQRLQKSQERLREISQRERGRTRGKKGRKQSVRYGNQFLKEWTPFKTDHRAGDEEVRLCNLSQTRMIEKRHISQAGCSFATSQAVNEKWHRASKTSSESQNVKKGSKMVDARGRRKNYWPWLAAGCIISNY